MTTCRDIARRALRKLSRIAAGQSPTGSDLVDAVETLQDIYIELAESGVFGQLHDIVVTTATYTAREQERVVCDSATGVTVTLPETITQVYESAYCGDDGDIGAPYYDSTCNGNGYFTVEARPPLDLACIQVTDRRSELKQTWVYNANRARWVLLEELNAEAAAPLGDRYPNALGSILAVRLAPEYGVSPAQSVVGDAARGLAEMTHNYTAERQPIRAEYF